MKLGRLGVWGSGLVVLCCVSVAWSSPMGQEIANQVTIATYRNFLDNVLYTHNGNNRDGLSGAQHNPCRSNIRDTFQGLGLSTQLESFSYSGTRYNVVATQTGTVHPNSYFLISGHYDSAGTPGADDDASGVAGVLEIARIFSTYRTEYTVKYVAFDFEEYGLIGSSAYVTSHPTDDIVGMISLDMIAYNVGTRSCDIYSRPISASLASALGTAIQLYGNGLSTSFPGPSSASDHSPFELAGHPACLLIEAWGNDCYHLACDSVDTADYIDYAFACDMTRSVAGYLADNAKAHPVDCNGNGIDDTCDVSCSAPGCAGIPGCGQSVDCNGNMFPDECEGGDLCPPTNLHWVQLPYPVSTTSVSMSASADDPSGVEYDFVAIGAGGHPSGWQAAQIYTDTGLEVNRNYSYKAKARDQSPQHTETAYTSSASVTTFIETPTALTFGTVTDTSIQATAPGTFTRLNQNLSGLYFEVTTLDGTPVGGSQVNTWTVLSLSQTALATGLTAGTTYRFRVKARNYFGVNETPWYPATGYVNHATTGGATCPLLGDVNGDGVVNGRDVDGFIRAKLNGTMLPGENQLCADYGGTLAHDITAFVADLLGL
ncbi:MAG TPA: M28 family peptidase [Phycisphaerae bacterium]|nr:M28 family peptidase [Phycisphaerae bacterium]